MYESAAGMHFKTGLNNDDPKKFCWYDFVNLFYITCAQISCIFTSSYYSFGPIDICGGWAFKGTRKTIVNSDSWFSQLGGNLRSKDFCAWITRRLDTHLDLVQCQDRHRNNLEAGPISSDIYEFQMELKVFKNVSGLKSVPVSVQTYVSKSWTPVENLYALENVVHEKYREIWKLRAWKIRKKMVVIKNTKMQVIFT